MLLKIYNPSGKLVTATQDFSYSGAAMGEKTISCTLLSAQKLDIRPNSYTEFRGERYLVRNEPSIKRTAGTGVRGDAFQTSIVFTSKQYELVDCDFMDYVLNDDMYYTGMDSFSFYGDVYDLCRRIQANLDGQYSGAERWVIRMPCKGYDAPQPITDIGWSDRVLNSETLQISPSNENCWNALARCNSDFGFFFYLDTAKKLIYVGVEYPEFRVENELITFEYGKGNGLYEIQRDVEANTVITKLRVKGSDRNIDRNYLRNESFPRFTQNLQLPVFRDTRHQARPTDYLLADQKLIDYFGVRPGSKTFDDIYPSITGVKDGNDNAIDEIHAIEQLDDTIEANGDLVQSYFYVYLYDLGFDINEFLTSEDATMSMKTGYCAGIDFKIVEASPLSAVEPYYNEGCRWKFRLEKDVTSSNNYVIPSGNVKPKKGDKFVLLYILMPESYVTGAEEKLEEAAQKYLDENSRSKISYTLNLDEIYLANRPIVARALKEAISMRIVDNELGDMQADDGRFYTVKSVQNLVITYKAEQQIPSYQITLAEKIISNPINRIENEIGNIAQNVQNNGSQNTVNRRNGIRNSRNLRALRDKLFDTDGYFDPENIRPNSIETQYLAVGAKSRDFTTNKISMKAYKEGDVFKVSLSTGYINHRALWWGGGDQAPTDVDKFTWGINDAVIQELSENDKDYYIYVKAERMSQLAEWFVSTDKLQYDFDKDYYYLLLGVIYPVQEDRRDISLVNGMAYIAGGAIYGDVIKSINYVDDDSNEGSMYDLNNGKFRLGNSKSGMDFGVSEDNTLSIAGAINALSAILGGFIIDNEKIQSLAKTSLNLSYKEEEISTGNGYIDAEGNQIFEADSLYRYSSFNSIGKDDKYVIVNSMGVDSPAKAITFYDQSFNKISASENVGLGIEQKVEKPKNAAYFSVSYHMNYPFILDVFGDERVNMVLNGSDGSGSLAAGGISWNSKGSQRIKGKFESNSSGDRIIIDPLTRQIKLISVNGDVAGTWSFSNLGGSTIDIDGVQLSGRGLDNNYSDYRYKFSLSDQGINCIEYDEDYNVARGFSATMSVLDNYLFVRMSGLPTTGNGLPAGFLYRSGDTIKIKT